MANKKLEEELQTSQASLAEVMDQLKDNQAAVTRLCMEVEEARREELEGEEETAKLQELEQRLQEMEEGQQKSQVVCSYTYSIYSLAGFYLEIIA